MNLVREVKIEEAFKLAKNNIKYCYLCGKEEIKVFGCCIPNDPANWLLGEPAPGKARTYWYGLCEECFKLPDKARLVEKKMESEMN